MEHNIYSPAPYVRLTAQSRDCNLAEAWATQSGNSLKIYYMSAVWKYTHLSGRGLENVQEVLQQCQGHETIHFIGIIDQTIFINLEYLKESFKMCSNKVSSTVVIININMTDIFTQFGCPIFCSLLLLRWNLLLSNNIFFTLSLFEISCEYCKFSVISSI